MQLPELNTERLHLRLLKETDDKEIFAIRSDEEVNRYLGRKPPAAMEDARNFITKVLNNINEGNSYYWAITPKETPALIGTICIWNISEDRKVAELGYELHPSQQGKGIMTEVLKAVIDFAFTKAGFTTLEAYTHKDNHSSTRLLINHGFRLQSDRKEPDNENIIIYKLERN